MLEGGRGFEAERDDAPKLAGREAGDLRAVAGRREEAGGRDAVRAPAPRGPEKGEALAAAVHLEETGPADAPGARGGAGREKPEVARLATGKVANRNADIVVSREEYKVSH